MYGYKIKINSLPKLIWACETTVGNYEWRNRNSRDVLEISFAKFIALNLTINNNSYILKNSALFCVMANEKREAYCEEKQSITIVSIAVRLRDFDYQPCELTEADCSDGTVVILPAFLEGLPLCYELDLIKILHEIIKLSANNSESKKIAFISTFFELLYKIDTITRNCIGIKNEKSNYYIKKIDSIINSEYNKKITLQSVAAELNISSVYLSTIYKNITGMNFSQQLLNVRMKQAEKLLIDQNIPTAKIAELCGFCDESYFRKKFKHFFHMNVREYRQIKNGLTLYHEKPQKRVFKD